MSYRPLPIVAQHRPAAWRSLLLWALLTALAISGFSMLRQLEGDADIVQAPAAQRPA
ncbi:hypothetical protein [Roseateles flavus]|uniref:Uncharacterized protein n=1 Tax=Roseateles flavus TaxID=3149041 RepID=A0ABV0GJ63_9BURK